VSPAPSDRLEPSVWSVAKGMILVLLGAAVVGGVAQLGLRLLWPHASSAGRAIGWTVAMAALAVGWCRWGEQRPWRAIVLPVLALAVLFALVSWLVP
jgi:hypothetical protein